VVGTPAYMPPEQAAGDIAAMGPQSDVYAVGAMLYHLLAGHMPYVPPGVKASNYAVWRWVTEGPPRPLHEVAPTAPVELAAICENAMARDPQARYEDMTALAGDLEAFVEGRVVSAYESGTWAETRKWVQRNKPLAAALTAAFLAVVVGGVAFALKADEATNAAVLAQKNEQEAKDNLTLAQRAQAETEEQRRAAEARAEDVLRLSALQDLEDVIGEADALWPPHPRLRAWSRVPRNA